MGEERYLSPADISKRLGVSRSRGYRIARECARLKFGRSVRVSAAAFAEWVAKHTIDPRSASGEARSDGRRVKLTRWPDGFDPHPSRPKKVVIGARRLPRQRSIEGEAPIRPTKPRT